MAGETLNFSLWWVPSSHLPSHHRHETGEQYWAHVGSSNRNSGLLLGVGCRQFWCSLSTPTWPSWSRWLYPLLPISKTSLKSALNKAFPTFLSGHILVSTPPSHPPFDVDCIHASGPVRKNPYPFQPCFLHRRDSCKPEQKWKFPQMSKWKPFRGHSGRSLNTIFYHWNVHQQGF